MLEGNDSRTEATQGAAGRYVAPPPAAHVDEFPDTRWTWILQARGDDRRDALKELCQAYWYPVFCFLRRHGAPERDAGDITQAVFLDLLDSDVLSGVERREDARFRSWLRTRAKRYFLNELTSARRLKRGGAAQHMTIDAAEAERKLDRELMHTLTPERLFDRCWARTVTERALLALKSRFPDPADIALMQEAIEELSGLADRARGGESATGTPVPGYERTRKSRRRKELLDEYRKCLRREIRGTVGNPAEIDHEIRHLLDVLPCRPKT